MRNIYLLFCCLPLVCFSQITTNPSTIEIDQSVTITVDLNDTTTDCNGINSPNKVYMHSGLGDDSNPWGYSVIGNWGEDDGVGEMTNNGDGTWSITFVPFEYYGITSSEANSVTKMGIVFRNEDGSQELKDNDCSDFFLNVGALQVTMVNPDQSNVIVVEYNSQTQIISYNSNGPANYELFIQGASYHSQDNTTFYQSSLITNITDNLNCSLVVTQGSSIVTKNFSIYVNKSEIENLSESFRNGINYHPNDPTKVTLVLEAPTKDFVYVAGSFNDYQPTIDYAMKKKPDSDIFWLEINDLTAGSIETYQYWVYDQNPTSGSPIEVKTADPYSTLVLSPFDDDFIPASNYPNLPAYPEGQKREVTVIETGQNDYNWQVLEFNKPAKENLVIYEILLRDFDTDSSFQNLIDRVEYFKNLNINAIELMPVMEFEGNESWGYNPAFHMALDKFYGEKNKFKELIDVFHQNGIAVILDLAFNHAFGRSPLVRMWMEDPDGNGWGDPSVENPYFNYEATHSYGVGADFNHSSTFTKKYTKRVIEHWIEEFKIDGFRWDLTKGFTQNCASGDDVCTNTYQSDRVSILKEYADHSWSVDPNHYVIFEHLGSQQEEKEWADYRIDEGKGILLWGNTTAPYGQLSMGYSSNSNLSSVGHSSRDFVNKHLIGYNESHDEERIMFNNLQYGASNSSYDVKELNTSLQRVASIGAVFFTVPGPKMIWHFGELGMDNSIYTCSDGTYDFEECKLDTKPQPQWVENWVEEPNRYNIYETWARLIELKTSQEVFKGNYAIDSGNLTPKIYVYDNTINDNLLKNVVILSNFDLEARDIVPYFPYPGTWYDLMDNSGETYYDITNTSLPITIEPGSFKIYGNVAVTENSLSSDDLNFIDYVEMYPNPSKNFVYFSSDLNQVQILDLNLKFVNKKINSYKRGQKINISNLDDGLYFVKIESNNNRIKYFKLLKN